MSRLISALLVQDRAYDLARAASDPAERGRLMAELGIEVSASN